MSVEAKAARDTSTGVTPAQFREAERGLKLMLARQFSAVWIAENAKDLLGQANVEYAEWLKANPPARNPVGWLLTCAHRRAINLLDKETRRPRSAPLEAVHHLADESTTTPEQQALDNDRQGRLREALGHLPDKERKLLALVYFEDMSIREAGRKLGWRKSAADRHHSAAMEKMLALVGERSLLSPAILGPVAWVTVNGEGERAFDGVGNAALGPVREGIALGSEAAEIGAHRLGELGRRLSPFADAGNAAASGGAGRVVGYCGAAAGAVVCGLLSSGAVGPGASALLSDPPRPQKPRPVEFRPASVSSPQATPTLSVPEPLPRRSAKPEATQGAKSPQPAAPRARDPRFRFPRASGEQSRSEFGDNNFEPGSPAPPSSPAPQAESGSSPSSSSPGSSRTPPASEFGF